jgi:hypothetical protein
MNLRLLLNKLPKILISTLYLKDGSYRRMISHFVHYAIIRLMNIIIVNAQLLLIPKNLNMMQTVMQL